MSNPTSPKSDESVLEDAIHNIDKPKELPLTEKPFNEEDLRFFYDEKGRLMYMGGVNDDFQIRHDMPHIIEDVDSVDLSFLDDALNSPTIKKWLEPFNEKSRFFKEAFENFFLLLIKSNPDIVPMPTPRQYFLLKLLTELVSHDEYEALAAKCTLNMARSTIVAKTWVDGLAKLLTDEDLKNIDELENLNQKLGCIFADMQDIMQHAGCAQPVPGGVDGMGKPRPVPGQGQGQAQGEGEGEGEGEQEGEPCPNCGKVHPKVRPQTAKEMGLTAEEARERMRNLTEQYSKLNAKVNQIIKDNQETLESLSNRFAKSGNSSGQDKMSQLNSLAKAAGTEEGELRQIDMEEILKISEKYRDNAELQLLIKELGRMRRIARKSMQAMTEEVENANNQPVLLDDSLQRLMPNEMVRSRHPKLRTDFKKRMIDKNLECFDTRGEQNCNRGPVLICKDTSGSMGGPPNSWATALGLTTGFVATSQGRRYALINFSSPGQLKISEFSKRTPFTKQIEEASYMFNGGTCFETPLNKCLDMIEEDNYDEADVLFLTDGICGLSEEFLTRFNKIKKDRKFKVITVLINIDGGDLTSVESFSDKVFLLSDLQDDQDVLETAFTL